MSDRRCTNVMYQQQLEHLPRSIKRKTLDSILKAIKEKLDPLEFAGIIHDSDKSENDPEILAAPHVHVFMRFKSARSLRNLAKLMNEPTTSPFTAWSKDDGNGWSYLVHQTVGAVDKYQYSIDDVKANFDYVEKINGIKKGVETIGNLKDSSVIKEVLDLLGIGAITKKEAEERLSGSQYAKARKKILDVHQRYLEKEFEKWRKEKKESNAQSVTIWLYGQAGTGKTALAKKYAEQIDKNYFMAGSSRDTFQAYESEHVIILDELRPDTFKYNDFLKMLDPFSNSVAAPSRYFDKYLQVETVIVTSPHSPKQFYNYLFNEMLDETDSFKQLARRLTIVQLVTDEYIELMTYDAQSRMYIAEPNTKRKNILLKELKQHETIDSRKLYEEINNFAPVIEEKIQELDYSKNPFTEKLLGDEKYESDTNDCESES